MAADGGNGTGYPLTLLLLRSGGEPPSPQHKACCRESAENREKQLGGHHRTDAWMTRVPLLYKTTKPRPVLRRQQLEAMAVEAAEQTAVRA